MSKCDRLVSGPEADSICGTTRSVRYRLLAEGKFPRPVKLGAATRFSARECHEWVAARIADRDGGER
jgi:prophage regulatory protein